MRYSLSLQISLSPNFQQELLLKKSIGCARFVYNESLRRKIAKHNTWKTLSEKKKADFDWSTGSVKQLKDEFEWLAKVPYKVLAHSLQNLRKAFKNFWKYSDYGYPQFKRKVRYTSIQFSQHIKIQNQTVYLEKIGYIPFRCSQKLLQQYSSQGKIKSITILQRADKWYGSILFAVPAEVYYQQANSVVKAVALDLNANVRTPIVITATNGQEGTLASSRNVKERLTQLELRRKRWQRKLARQIEQQKKDNKVRKKKKQEVTKGLSKNAQKTQLKLQKCYEKESNVRKDYHKKLAHRLVSTCENVVIEDLKLQKMTKANGNYKRSLNRNMLQLAFGGLRIRLSQKAKRMRSSIIVVNPAYTSQSCSDCGYVSKLNRENQSKFICVECGFKLHADLNAARNILAKGLKQIE